MAVARARLGSIATIAAPAPRRRTWRRAIVAPSFDGWSGREEIIGLLDRESVAKPCMATHSPRSRCFFDGRRAVSAVPSGRDPLRDALPEAVDAPLQELAVVAAEEAEGGALLLEQLPDRGSVGTAHRHLHSESHATGEPGECTLQAASAVELGDLAVDDERRRTGHRQ